LTSVRPAVPTVRVYFPSMFVNAARPPMCHLFPETNVVVTALESGTSTLFRVRLRSANENVPGSIGSEKVTSKPSTAVLVRLGETVEVDTTVGGTSLRDHFVDAAPDPAWPPASCTPAALTVRE